MEVSLAIIATGPKALVLIEDPVSAHLNNGVLF